ncbi:ring finger domain-containing protein [Hirsutella rhossiliensis]|uniref:Ring finger domain-containing protein n=1 Tax=Hirsutella rhossiliensis TaxID=111463 RepID=A0A9P8N2V5_9HYPO|nr:ring finger domain-containing protein [Hirsutella rhossiliensis]KAH0967283.1 ring finger domain-containing protein [Hirsutella rhossiliensis]
MRQLQLARGAAASKMVASRAALQSLQSVNVNDLSHNEKMCVICYNDYGVESPEGINEAPLRLPKCKHVFGEHCIKKWFEDSDSCPYCRDKLPSEPKPNHGSARTFLNMMRLRGYPLPTGSIPEHLLSRIMGNSVGDDDFINAMARQGRAVERRSPPDDATGEDQRRTRQRRGSPTPPDRALSASRGARKHPRMLPLSAR